MEARGIKAGRFVLSLLAIAISQPVSAADDARMLDEVVVTAPAMEEPLVVKTDPRNRASRFRPTMARTT